MAGQWHNRGLKGQWQWQWHNRGLKGQWQWQGRAGQGRAGAVAVAGQLSHTASMHALSASTCSRLPPWLGHTSISAPPVNHLQDTLVCVNQVTVPTATAVIGPLAFHFASSVHPLVLAYKEQGALGNRQ